MNVERIAELEDQLRERMPKGTLESMHEYCTTHGLYDKWTTLFRSYCKLAKAGDFEALKRVVFFLWYQQSEPVALSGFASEWGDEADDLLRVVNEVIENGGLDSEFGWMLQYYYQMTDWYIDGYKGIEAFRDFSQSTDSDWRTEIAKSKFDNRGQMGWYWASLKENV